MERLVTESVQLTSGRHQRSSARNPSRSDLFKIKALLEQYIGSQASLCPLFTLFVLLFWSSSLLSLPPPHWSNPQLSECERLLSALTQDQFILSDNSQPTKQVRLLSQDPNRQCHMPKNKLFVLIFINQADHKEIRRIVLNLVWWKRKTKRTTWATHQDRQEMTFQPAKK